MHDKNADTVFMKKHFINILTLIFGNILNSTLVIYAWEFKWLNESDIAKNLLRNLREKLKISKYQIHGNVKCNKNGGMIWWSFLYSCYDIISRFYNNKVTTLCSHVSEIEKKYWANQIIETGYIVKINF